MFDALSHTQSTAPDQSSDDTPDIDDVIDSRPVTVTIVGDSMIRGVAPLVSGPDIDAVGFVYPGRTARQINARFRNIPETDITVIAAGTNNTESHSLDQCKSDMSAVIDNVSKKRSNGHVVISCIPYRFDKPELNPKIDLINDHIESQIKNRSNWHLLRNDGIIPEDYKKDKLHFNETGLVLFALEVRHICRLIMRE